MFLYCPSSPTAVEIGELNKPNLLLEPIRSVSCRIVDLCAYISLIIFIVIILIEYDFEMYFMLSSFDRFLCLLFGWAVGVCYFCCFYCFSDAVFCLSLCVGWLRSYCSTSSILDLSCGWYLPSSSLIQILPSKISPSVIIQAAFIRKASFKQVLLSWYWNAYLGMPKLWFIPTLLVLGAVLPEDWLLEW